MHSTSFSAFRFRVTGAPTPRTLPDRLAETKNVRDFGATGDRSTDDLSAIQAAFNWTVSNNRGTIYFPPGTYRVSAPIDLSEYVVNAHLIGEMGLSTIVGDLSDYVIKRGILGNMGGTGGGHLIKKLKIINKHANGGGIRFGNCVGGAIRNCDITANQGINTAQDDSLIGGGYWGSMEISIENCHLRPGANVAGSCGIMQFADGPVTNCTVIGFDVGMKIWGGQGCQTLMGCYFERNNIGLYPGMSPRASASVSNYMVSGCRFKNNGTAIWNAGGYARYCGVLIEASEGTIAGNPQYGIRIDGVRGKAVLFSGVLVTGQYQTAGIYIAGGELYCSQNTFIGVRSVNTSTLGGVAWRLPNTAHTADFINCNVTPVFKMSQLPAKTLTISSITWSRGLATITVSSWHGLSPGKNCANITVAGVTPSRYNGTFMGANVVGHNQFTYPVSDPGGASSGGTVFATGVAPPGLPNVFEGYCYNVSDSNTATWGAPAAAGGSHHVKVRYNGTSWTVMGA